MRFLRAMIVFLTLAAPATALASDAGSDCCCPDCHGDCGCPCCG